MIAGHGPNIGHGYVKYVFIDAQGVELDPIVFPAQIAPAGRSVAGALHAASAHSDGNGGWWWVGEDAQLAPSPLTLLAQERLHDPTFIPVLLKAALARLGHLNGSAAGHCVTGLPATWAQDAALAQALGGRLRAATERYERIKVIAEPLGLMYAALLDNDGATVGDPALAAGRVGVVDLGHHTVDTAVLRRGVPEPAGLHTWELGTARPLASIGAQLGARFERELSLYETDRIVRAGALRVRGRSHPLPAGWDRPLSEAAGAIVARLRERWGSGGALDLILVGGGGAEVPQLAEAIEAAYPHAVIVDRPQTAIARGYARLARRLGRS